jgi:hypothetical protein
MTICGGDCYAALLHKSPTSPVIAEIGKAQIYRGGMETRRTAKD